MRKTRPLHHAFMGVMAALTISVSSANGIMTDGDSSSLNNPASRRYWNIMESGPRAERIAANEALIDFEVGTINTMYYDNSGGAFFTPREFYGKWKALRDASRNSEQSPNNKNKSKNTLPSIASLDNREGAVNTLKWVASNLQDPFSSYLTREELRKELEASSDKNGFLGLGAVVESPITQIQSAATKTSFSQPVFSTLVDESIKGGNKGSYKKTTASSSSLLNPSQVTQLPIISAVVPDSPAERAGLTVGDRIVSVGKDKFTLSLSPQQVDKTLLKCSNSGKDNDCPDFIVAKPVWKTLISDGDGDQVIQSNVVVGYRTSKIKLSELSFQNNNSYKHGDATVHYEMLTAGSSLLDTTTVGSTNQNVGYIRLTRFSRASTAGFLKAIDNLEAQGAQSYIVDLRNNYGGVIQEAMLLSSTLLRDPHAVLCYTMNSRGGFTPHE